ncbi:MAG: SCO family protein [Verrucomicrobiota bacterium]|nr:SCO family protein [Verrucomicrobiota bacterium]
MRSFVPRHAVLALVLGSAVVWSGCSRSDQNPADARQYEARGIVRGFAPDHSTAQIEHENIPGFMPSMTMPFEVRDEKEIADLKIGDAISFRLNVTDRDSWIDRIKQVNSATVHLPTPSPSASSVKSERVHEGDVMPAFSLLDQQREPLTLENFRGHPFVLTFIFTRCPIPNFCPRMSQNFSELQKAIKTMSGPPGETRLLSISFDPANDTPAVLKAYAQNEGADPAIWTFATGDPAEIQKLTKAFSVLVQPEQGTISHGLATALVGKDGKIEKIWRGNAWKPAEVLQELSSPSAATRP